MDKNEISRREFVRRSTGAGIALAASPFSWSQVQRTA